ncbi:hypothetical protein HOO65_060304 [Ceratocystis lukuohia]|uniref:C2H2-type domain-containing protein n=1 Tax=Ceratocystis lukuohia TaxID=2019550 RepID=A0ABR4MDX6_9PEZI
MQNSDDTQLLRDYSDTGSCSRSGSNTSGEQALDSTLTNDEKYTFACPYYIFDSSKYAKCFTHEIGGLHRLPQHIIRTHMNWCDRCKESFHSPKELDKHSENASCQPQAEYPVGYLNKSIFDNRIKAGSGASEQEKYRHLYQALFNRDLPANIYFKYHGPPHGEAYGQAMLHTFLQCITDKIAETPMYQFLPLHEAKKLLISMIQDVADSLMNATEMRRQELSQLATKIVQKGLGPMSPPSLLVPGPFTLPVGIPPTEVAPPESLNLNLMWLLQGGQNANTTYQQPYSGYVERRFADVQWPIGTLDLTAYTNLTPGAIGNMAPTALDRAPGNYVNGIGAGNHVQFPTNTNHNSDTGFEVGISTGWPLQYTFCFNCGAPVRAENAALLAATVALCGAC